MHSPYTNAEERKWASKNMNAKRSFSIHRIREVSLEEVSLERDYVIERLVGQGSFGKLHLAQHRPTSCTIVLKAIHKDRTKMRDFLREFHYAHFLSPHRNIVMAYDVAFQTNDSYVFAQEHALYGDLARAIDDGLLGGEDVKAKIVAKQVASALEFMHSKLLVHRDVRPHNVLVFAPDFTCVKLTDFGLTCLAGTLVKRTHLCLAYTPPEICEAVFNEGYTVASSSDVWQMALLVVLCLVARLPWQQADIVDSGYTEFWNWQKRKTTRTPTLFRGFSERLLRMLRRMLDPKIENRPKVKEVFKYLDDKWVVGKGPPPPPFCGNGDVVQNSIARPHSAKGKESPLGLSAHPCGDDSSSADMTPTGKDETLRQLLTQYGIETTIDLETKRQRIREWIMAASP